MKAYKIIGLGNAKQAERITMKFKQIAAADSDKIHYDPESAELWLPDTIDAASTALISSFEHVSILDAALVEEKDMEDHDDHAHHDKNHSHSHSHAHSHRHSHDHSHADFTSDAEGVQRNMLWVFLLNIFFSISEFVFGAIFNSQAILSDAVHDLGDAVSIGLAWIFQKLSLKRANERFSYGFRRFSLLGALITSIVLLVGSLSIIRETIPRLLNPEPLDETGVFWVAIAAIFINFFSMRLMSKGRSTNERLLNLHLLEDLLGWIAVLAMSIILRFTDWYILDPILSLLIAAWIIYNTLPEFIRILRVFLQAVPADINTERLSEKIAAIPSVHAISHMHIWSTDGQQHMMSLTVATASDQAVEYERIKQAIRLEALADHIYHVTIEILYDPQYLLKGLLSCEC